MTPLHPLAEKFADVASEYELGRPEYAPAAVGALAAELGLERGSRVLDLAAGTGKLTRALVAYGFDVVAVEPQAEMAERLAASVGAERVHEGVAEAIPLPDASIDAVTVADGFHWFDQGPALTEIRRVLRPRGGLAILATFPDWGTATWAHELGALVDANRPEHPYFDGPPWQDAVRAAGAWAEPREIRVTTSMPAAAERIVAYLESMSWMAAMPEAERSDFVLKATSLIAEGGTPDEMPVHVVIGLTSLT